MTLRREATIAAGESIKQNAPTGFRPGRAGGSGGGGGTGAAPFGRQLRDLRLQSGLSQTQLARSSTLSVRAIRDLENGRVRQPRADSLRLLADALGLSAPQLNRLTNDHSLGLLAAGAAEPAMSGPFIGREQELAALTTMLGAEHHRLVTITGIEGVGKTRLALEVAHALEAAERTAVLWLPLDDDRLRGGRTAHGAPERPAWLREVVPPGPDSCRRLVEAVGESNGLLVLDGARPGHELADFTAALLAGCPRLRIVVTTRTPVDMPLETLFPLAPLAVPTADTEPAELGEVASVALLLARTRRVQPGFCPGPDALADVARICRALDGLPAALESAAHWSLIYSLRQLAHQLTTDPLAVARRPDGGRQQPDAYASVRHTIATLSGRQRDLLSAMSHPTSHPPSHPASREADGYWSIPEVAHRTGRTAAECADDIYHLLILGILRRVDHQDVAKFGVLNIAGVAGRNTIAGQHAAA